MSQPIHQEGRSRRACDCGAPCFYCGTGVQPFKHEHDHVPIPHRHGGRETVAACLRCHSLKDREAGFDEWLPGMLAAAEAGVTRDAAFALAAIVSTLRDPEFGTDPDLMRVDVDRDTALSLIDGCTTPEARIAVARVLCFALDAQTATEEQEAA